MKNRIKLDVDKKTALFMTGAVFLFVLMQLLGFSKLSSTMVIMLKAIVVFGALLEVGFLSLRKRRYDALDISTIVVAFLVLASIFLNIYRVGFVWLTQLMIGVQFVLVVLFGIQLFRPTPKTRK